MTLVFLILALVLYTGLGMWMVLSKGWWDGAEPPDGPAAGKMVRWAGGSASCLEVEGWEGRRGVLAGSGICERQRRGVEGGRGTGSHPVYSSFPHSGELFLAS